MLRGDPRQRQGDVGADIAYSDRAPAAPGAAGRLLGVGEGSGGSAGGRRAHPRRREAVRTRQRRARREQRWARTPSPLGRSSRPRTLPGRGKERLMAEATARLGAAQASALTSRLATARLKSAQDRFDAARAREASLADRQRSRRPRTAPLRMHTAMGASARRSSSASIVTR